MRGAKVLKDAGGLAGIRDDQIEAAFMHLAERHRLTGIRGFQQVIAGGFEEVVQFRPNGTAPIYQ